MTATLDAKKKPARKPATKRKATTRKPAEDTPTEIKWAELLDIALTTPGNIGNVYNRFYNYSFLNCLLMMSQGATGPVATYGRWQELGRQVRRGEKALWIVRPITITKEDENDPDKTRSFRKFKFIKSPFDLSCTDGPDLPPVELADWDLELALKTLEITRIPFSHLNGNVQGYSTERTFAINPVAKYPTKTTLHELAHILLGHTVKDFSAEYVLHRGVAEFQAESVAYLAMKEFGIDDGSESVSRAYIQGWLEGEKPGDAAIRQVFSAVNKLITAGRPQQAEEK
jgi:antirestriction protein ArdC